MSQTTSFLTPVLIVSSSVNRNFQEFKQKMRVKEKHNMVIIVALMHKLLYIIFAILKNKSIVSYELAEFFIDSQYSIHLDIKSQFFLPIIHSL
ncbi:MAG: hypothetical protein KBD25_05720 [Rickettsiaceae bacterium]|nr:hypothetical protein [Rickettsiaceae bacterium]